MASKKLAFFPGCSLDGTGSEYGHSTLAVLEALGTPAEILDDWNCCGATAARGIDLPNLELVIHADIPKTRTTLLHRSGRTGRAGSEGTARSLVSTEEGQFLRDIERLLRKDIPVQDVDFPRRSSPADRPQSANQRHSRQPQGNRSGGGRSGGGSRSGGGGRSGGSTGSRTSGAASQAGRPQRRRPQPQR